MPGKIVRVTGPLSYQVQVSVGVVRRHVDNIRQRSSESEAPMEVEPSEEMVWPPVEIPTAEQTPIASDLPMESGTSTSTTADAVATCPVAQHCPTASSPVSQHRPTAARLNIVRQPQAPWLSAVLHGIVPLLTITAVRLLLNHCLSFTHLERKECCIQYYILDIHDSFLDHACVSLVQSLGVQSSGRQQPFIHSITSWSTSLVLYTHAMRKRASERGYLSLFLHK